MFKDNKVETINLAVAVRWAIAHIYTVVLGSPLKFETDVSPPKEQWTGKSGIFSGIRRLMPGWKEIEDMKVAKSVATGGHPMTSISRYCLHSLALFIFT